MWHGPDYDVLSDPQRSWGAAVLDRLDLRGGATVLDAGAGSGRVTESLLATNDEVRVIAVDASASMLDAARRRLERFADRVTFVEMSLTEPFPASLTSHGPVDAVLSTGTFHWVLDHEALYRRLFDLLVPGGQLVAQFGGDGSVAEVRSALADLGIDTTGMNNYANAPQTLEWCERAGFVEVDAWMHDELVELPDHDARVEYLAAAVIAPYVAGCTPPERRAIAEQVAASVGDRGLRFVRTNLVARRPGA